MSLIPVEDALRRLIDGSQPLDRTETIPLAEAGGRVSIELFGTYYPNGHKGDYSVAESASARIVYERAI